MQYRVGNPVIGGDFWPRPDVVDDIHARLTKHEQSVRLFGLRRIGKTSVLLELERRLREGGSLTVVRIDAQAFRRFGDFLAAIVGELPEGRATERLRTAASNNPMLKSLFSAALRKIGVENEREAGFQNEFSHQAFWSGNIQEMFRNAGSLVLLIDELPYMIRNMLVSGIYKPNDIESFLAELRGWRMNAGVRMVLAGSLGLAQIRRMYDVSVNDHIGDIHPRSLPPLMPDDAKAMVEELVRGEGGEGWTPELTKAVVDTAGDTWPIFLQLGCKAILDAGIRDPGQVAGEIARSVRPIADEQFHTQFSTRLSRYGEDERAARTILRTVVRAEPVGFDLIDKALEEIDALERCDDLLDALREDDFIEFDTEARTVRTASRLVPVWVRSRSWGRR